MAGDRLAIVAAVTVFLLPGCGGGGQGRGDEPASIVPSSAFLYFEANLDPKGDQEAAVQTVLAALPGVGAPEQRLQEQFNAYALRRYGRRAADFKRDIAPWLGDRLASFALVPRRGTDPGRAPSGLIASTRDRDKARHWLFEVSRRDGEKKRSFRGVRYLWMGGKERMAYGVVDGFVVAADEPAFKAVVARGRAGSLDKRRRFARAVGDGHGDGLGLLWYDTHQLFDTLARRVGRGYLRRALPALRRLVPDEPLVLRVRAKNKRVVVEGEVPVGKGGAFTSIFDEGGALMDQLPKDALAVIGQPDFGDYVRELLSLSEAGHGGYAALRRSVRRRGLDLERDLLGWMTDGAFFLR
ncbi:MAG: hypothetical protein QOI98_213, partial [Solirubrobacteraceae bacterium]|nr:hypothetical protein [Solirubrobacteraceae bacterium]